MTSLLSQYMWNIYACCSLSTCTRLFSFVHERLKGFLMATFQPLRLSFVTRCNSFSFLPLRNQSVNIINEMSRQVVYSKIRRQNFAANSRAGLYLRWNGRGRLRAPSPGKIGSPPRPLPPWALTGLFSRHFGALDIYIRNFSLLSLPFGSIA